MRNIVRDFVRGVNWQHVPKNGHLLGDTTGILPVAVTPDWESRHLGGDPAASTSFRYGEGSERAAKLFGATMVG